MLEEKLKAEAPRILAWALQGCLDWQKHGLGRPESVSAATADYFANQDLLGQWIDERCEVGPRLWDQPGTLFASWVEFARRSGEDAGTSKSFRTTLEKRGFPWSRSNGVRKHTGISVRSGSADSAG
ncbi:hypothetical protein EON62_05800 [archaeon]|nr:MAG: hypothetical protein EON62_05800 [archaeon]